MESVKEGFLREEKKLSADLEEAEKDVLYELFVPGIIEDNAQEIVAIHNYMQTHIVPLCLPEDQKILQKWVLPEQNGVIYSDIKEYLNDQKENLKTTHSKDVALSVRFLEKLYFGDGHAEWEPVFSLKSMLKHNLALYLLSHCQELKEKEGKALKSLEGFKTCFVTNLFRSGEAFECFIGQKKYEEKELISFFNHLQWSTDICARFLREMGRQKNIHWLSHTSFDPNVDLITQYGWTFYQIAVCFQPVEGGERNDWRNVRAKKGPWWFFLTHSILAQLAGTGLAERTPLIIGLKDSYRAAIHCALMKRGEEYATKECQGKSLLEVCIALKKASRFDRYMAFYAAAYKKLEDERIQSEIKDARVNSLPKAVGVGLVGLAAAGWELWNQGRFIDPRFSYSVMGGSAIGLGTKMGATLLDNSMRPTPEVLGGLPLGLFQSLDLEKTKEAETFQRAYGVYKSLTKQVSKHH